MYQKVPGFFQGCYWRKAGTAFLKPSHDLQEKSKRFVKGVPSNTSNETSIFLQGIDMHIVEWLFDIPWNLRLKYYWWNILMLFVAYIVHVRFCFIVSDLCMLLKLPVSLAQLPGDGILRKTTQQKGGGKWVGQHVVRLRFQQREKKDNRLVLPSTYKDYKAILYFILY